MNRFDLLTNIKTAILNGEGTFSINNEVVVSLPSPQTSGTGTQQSTYAAMKAQEIVDQVWASL